MTLINVTSNSVCLQFQFVSGSTPNIDIIQLFDNQGNIHFLHIMSLNDQLNFVQCIANISVGNSLTLYACERVTLDDCTTNPPAVITGINITNDSTSSVLMSSVHSSSVSLTSTVLTISSMMSLPLIISTLLVSSTTLTVPTNAIVPTASLLLTTSTVQQVTSSTIISSTTATPTISSSTFIHITRLTSTLVTG